jgi:hypothetical protein
MSFNRNIWERSIGFVSIDSLPAWPCPACQKSELVVDKSTLNYQTLKTQFNADEFNSEAFEEGFLMGLASIAATYVEVTNWAQARFAGFLRCHECSEIVVFAGRAKLPVIKPQQKHCLNRSETILPEYFSPPLPILHLTYHYPKNLKLELVRSFSVFFSDTASAGNRLRAAIELILKDQGLKNVLIGDDGEPKKNKHGRTIYRNLNERILEFKKQNNDLGDVLLALKLLGNEGSHGNGFTKEDLLEAYAVIEYLLEELYVRPLRRKEVMNKTTLLKQKYEN